MKLALQAAAAVHVGVANQKVVRQVVRLIEGLPPCQPVALHNAGDLLLLVQGMFEKKGSGLTRVSKVKGHADDDMVRSDQVRELDREGDDKVDDADCGRRKVSERY